MLCLAGTLPRALSGTLQPTRRDRLGFTTPASLSKQRAPSPQASGGYAAASSAAIPLSEVRWVAGRVPQAAAAARPAARTGFPRVSSPGALRPASPPQQHVPELWKPARRRHPSPCPPAGPMTRCRRIAAVQAALLLACAVLVAGRQLHATPLTPLQKVGSLPRRAALPPPPPRPPCAPLHRGSRCSARRSRAVSSTTPSWRRT